MDEDFLERLRVDTTFVPRRSVGRGPDIQDDGNYLNYTDDWGIGWRMPKEGGFYYDFYFNPLDVDDLKQRLATYSWPDPTDSRRFEGLREKAQAAREKGKLVVLQGFCAGICEVYSWLRGYESFYSDLAAEPDLAEMVLDRLTELKIAYWRRALAEVGELVDVVNEADDISGQNGPLMSPATYRRLVKPRHAQIYSAIKKAAPRVKIFMHSCGAVREFVPDFIEIGVDILNPVQISAAGMDPFELKRDFGKDIVFWGGGVDTQHVLGSGTVEDVRDNVKRNIDALAPGGGFVFTTVHITQANVPPQNYLAMWETLQEYGAYSQHA
ncbi:MAG: hypothetical protein HYX78_12985 [Armatimonadetes bacterium]|nr:hypothetical protein [Armatimonadota bacterium]